MRVPGKRLMVGGSFAVGVFVGVTVAVVLVVFGLADSAGRAPDPLRESQSCYSDLLRTGKFVTHADLSEAAKLCSERLGYAYALNDYVIRRAGFMAQQRQGDAIALLVMVITLSGVAMAAFQMVTAFRLAQRPGVTAASPEASSLSLEAGKLSVQTSVTGILVLGLSLGFFTIYVLNVYKIEFAPENSPPAASATLRPELGVGVPEEDTAGPEPAKP